MAAHWHSFLQNNWYCLISGHFTMRNYLLYHWFNLLLVRKLWKSRSCYFNSWMSFRLNLPVFATGWCSCCCRRYLPRIFQYLYLPACAAHFILIYRLNRPVCSNDCPNVHEIRTRAGRLAASCWQIVRRSIFPNTRAVLQGLLPLASAPIKGAIID